MINSNLDQAHVYTEFSGLNALKSQARHDKTAALESVSKQFESLFISMMMKSMREANKTFSEGNFLNSSQTEFYQEMFDSQLSLTLSKGQGVGLAEAMMRQMSKQIEGVDGGESDKLHLYKNISDYPRNLPVEKTIRKAVELVDTIVQIEAKVSEAAREDNGTRDSEAVTDIASMQNPLPTRFSTPDEFIAHLYPLAQKVESETGISAKVMVAQSALETGWGKHMIGGADQNASFNLFGIKADDRWSGDKVEIVTTEYRDGVAMKEKAAFRSYDSYEDSFRDYANFLQVNPRYEPAMQYLNNPEKFTQTLQDAGYATDPAYGKKIQRILNGELFNGAINSVNGSDHRTEEGAADLLKTTAAL